MGAKSRQVDASPDWPEAVSLRDDRKALRAVLIRERPQGKRQAFSRAWVIGLAVTVVVIILCVIAVFGRRSVLPEYGRFSSVSACEVQVRQTLGLPSTVVFADSANGSGDAWVVSGTVDDGRSLGDPILKSFQCTVTLHGKREPASVVIDYVR